MTKQQLKEKYSKWNIKNGSVARNRNNEIFHKMQDLSEEINLPRYCGMNSLLVQLIGTSKENIALNLFAEYNSNLGRQESLSELAILTNNFEIK